jgi:very-short-patch-repair endonuclease
LAQLEQQYNVQFQPKFDWCRGEITKKHLPFDFLLIDFNIIIELDGPQHFKQVANWQSPEEAQERDLFKAHSANNNGYTIIRLLQEDVLYDRIDWWEALQENIKALVDEQTEPTMWCIEAEDGTLYDNLIVAYNN